MRISLEFYNHIRENVRVSDIVRQRVMLTKKGGEYLGVCPFHNEKSPSFTVNDAKRFYHCFGCSAHGDVIRFVSETNGISYKEAAVKIAGDNGIELPKLTKAEEQRYEETDHIYKILDLAMQFFASNLTNDIQKYLIQRGLKEESIKDFAIGYAPGNGALERFFENKSIPLKDLLKAGLVGRKEDGRIYEIFNKRIMFPIKNIYNKVVGFGGRAVGDNMPKYINSPETIVFKKGETMYGENIATGHAYKDNYSIVVEGYMDVIALHQAGFKQAVASLGTSVTDKHIQKLWRSGDEIVACLDGDNAGIRASVRLIDMALPNIEANKIISFVELPSGLDPDDLIKSSGSQAFSKILSQRLGLSEMIWKYEYEGKNFKTAESKTILEQKLREYCKQIQDKSLQANFSQYFKDMVWNNLVKKKSSANNQAVLSKELISAKQYSEIEVLEHSICAFLTQYPDVLSSPDHRNDLSEIQLENKSLSDYKDNLLDITEGLQDLSTNQIEGQIKSSSFYDTYLLLSSPDVRFLDLAFLNKKSVDSGQVFGWLCKKHYLLLLKQEYMNALKRNADDSQSKSISYLQEIQKVSKELSQLSDYFINN
ncbi:MAG: DNA primase [Rickettsiaceae bacterium]|nr:DNA primase [Rickettsiaceae bacterium]